MEVTPNANAGSFTTVAVRTRRLEESRRRSTESVPAGMGAYSCEVPPVRFVELITGQGRNDSPGEVAARSVELIEAMHRSAAADGIPVDVWRQVA